MKQFFFFRHAESEANANNRLICGRSDHIPLTSRGEQQARMLGKRLADEAFSFDQVFSSVSVRAQQTAQFVCSELGVPHQEIQLSDQIVEIEKGEWEGKLRAEMYTPALRKMLQDNSYHFKPPGGESQAQVESRMVHWLTSLQNQLPPSSKVAIFSHGFAIKAMLIALFGMKPERIYQMVLHNSSISVLQNDTGAWILERINDHAHIARTSFVGYYW